MTLAVQIDQTGGPEQLKLVDVTVGDPGPGEIRIRHKAIGLNFIDVYQRSGLYPFAMPLKLGMEGAGIVEAVGEGVTHLKVGDRAAYAEAIATATSFSTAIVAQSVALLNDIGVDAPGAVLGPLVRASVENALQAATPDASLDELPNLLADD